MAPSAPLPQADSDVPGLVSKSIDASADAGKKRRGRPLAKSNNGNVSKVSLRPVLLTCRFLVVSCWYPSVVVCVHELFAHSLRCY